MSLLFFYGATESYSWRRGSISTTPLGVNSYVTGVFPAAHTRRGESLYSLAYLKYQASISITSISDISSGVRTIVTATEHGFSVGDVIAIAGNANVNLNEPQVTIVEVATSTSFKYVSAAPAGTGGASGTVALYTGRTYHTVNIKASMPGSAKSSCLIGIGANKNVAATAITSPFGPPTLSTGTFASSLTLPDSVIGRSGGVGGLVAGDWVPIWIKRTANAYTTFTSTSNSDVGLTLSVTASY